MKVFNDLTYSPLFSTSASLASLLSDETGSGGGFVRATSSVLESPRINVGSDATGDMYYRAAGGVLTRIPIGSNTHLLQITGGVPAFSAYTPDFSAVQRFSAGFVSAASSTFAAIARFDVLPESSAVATTSAQLTPRSMSDYNAYALMSTSTRSGSLIASTSLSMATNCNSTTVTRQKGYKVWNYGNVYVFASSTNSQAFQSSLYLSKNGAGTTTATNSTTNTLWVSAVFSVEPGDELQVWCSEDNASANLTGVSDFAIFATSSQKEPVAN